MAKVVLLGLDGATFSLLDPLLQENRLPFLVRMARSGVRGLLRSTIHPLTPAAWTSCVTGLNPGKHGIYDFRRRRAGAYALELVNARQRAGQPLWSILSRQGRRVGVFNVPMTYPPEPVNGFMVSGMDTPGTESNFVYPPALRTVLLDAVPGYAIDLDESTESEDVFLERLLALASAEVSALDMLVARHPDLDFLMAVFVATDRLYHTFWRYLDPAHPDYASERAARVRAIHEQLLCDIDAALGRLYAWAGEDATFMIVSDHGFGSLEKDVYMNRFLLDAGFLRFREGQEGRSFAEMVDWQHTRAYSFGFFGNININVRGREPLGCVEQGRETEDVKRALTAALHDLRDPQSGEVIVDAVYRREDLYSGPYVDDAPDLLVVMRNYAYMTRDGYEGMRRGLVGLPMSLSGGRLVHTGNHRLDGVFMMAGPGVRAGQEISGATLLDIAPTVLYALGLPAPAEMDGHVLKQAMSDEMLAQRPPRRVASPLPPPESAGRRQVSALAQQVGDLEAKVRQLHQDKDASSAYAQQLETTMAAKNAHIAELETTLHAHSELLDRYQRSSFYRAYQRWLKMTGSHR